MMVAMKTSALLLALNGAVNGFNPPMSSLRSSETSPSSLNLFDLPQIMETAAVGASLMLTLSKGKGDKKVLEKDYNNKDDVVAKMFDEDTVLDSSGESSFAEESEKDDKIAEMFEDGTVLDEFLSDTQQKEEETALEDANESGVVSEVMPVNSVKDKPAAKSTAAFQPPEQFPRRTTSYLDSLTNTRKDAPPRSEAAHRAILEKRLGYEKEANARKAEREAVEERRSLLKKRLGYEKDALDQEELEELITAKPAAEISKMANTGRRDRGYTTPDYTATDYGKNAAPRSEPFHRAILERRLNYEKVDNVKRAETLAAEEKRALLEQRLAYEKAEIAREAERLAVEEERAAAERETQAKKEAEEARKFAAEQEAERKAAAEKLAAQAKREAEEASKYAAKQEAKKKAAAERLAAQVKKQAEEASELASKEEVEREIAAQVAIDNDPVVDEVRQKIMEEASQRTKTRMALSNDSAKASTDSSVSETHFKSNVSHPAQIDAARPDDSIKRYNGPDKVVSNTSPTGNLIEVNSDATEGKSPMRFLRRKKNYLIAGSLALVIVRRVVITILRGNML